MPDENKFAMDSQALCLQQGKSDGTSQQQQQTKVFLLKWPSETQLILPETHPCDDFLLTEHNNSIQPTTNLFIFDSSSSKAFPLYISSSFYTSNSSPMGFPIISVTENTTYPNSNPGGEITNCNCVFTFSQSDVTSFKSQNIVNDHEEKFNRKFVVPPAEASPSFYDQSLLKCLRKESDDESMFPIFSEEESNAHQNIDSPAHYTEPFDMSLLLNQNLCTETPTIPSLIPIHEKSFQEMPFTANLIREKALSIDMFPKPCPTLMPTMEDYDTRIAALAPDAILLFNEQMRKHVQLLTQMHLITAQQSTLVSVTEECRSMLQDLLSLKQNMEIANLDEALDLVTYWETNVTKTSPETLFKFERTVVTSGERKKFVKRSSKHPNRYPFNPTMVKLMAESRVFIYPELLPTLAIFQSEPGPCKMSLHEEQLIAMGMEQFTPYCTELLNDDAKVSSKENLVHTMISLYMLPHWTAKQIATRIKNKSFNNKRNKNESNPIKYYRTNKVAPPIHHVVQPFDRYTTKRLCDVPISLLPERWQELFSKPNAAGKRPLQPITHQGQPRTTAGINQQDEAHPIVKRRRVLGELIN
ncbi:uncharacterized protein LOC124316215 [Daphnia pulicaria]|uniref:uncharacterized protein LOC124316215 n=1 Tax=Daphnia pulicaria TaxID=35523 RepID=UPI001EEC098F|nr:uncharacterized protein LOC124316215 [Daphnia pulicaria]XP_046637981.1 uncharacterized protein LOC124316215 [Daphnia pulicaria]